MSQETVNISEQVQRLEEQLEELMHENQRLQDEKRTPEGFAFEKGVLSFNGIKFADLRTLPAYEECAVCDALGINSMCGWTIAALRAPETEAMDALKQAAAGKENDGSSGNA